MRMLLQYWLSAPEQTALEGGKGQSGVGRVRCLSLDSRAQRGFRGNAKLCLPHEWGGQAGPWQFCDYCPEHASGSGFCFLIFKSWGQVARKM